MGSEEPSQPPIGLPLSLVLLVIFLCFMGGLFFGCLHWHNLQFLFGASSHDQDNSHNSNPEVIEHAPHKSHQHDLKENERDSLPVLMPGDEVPKFIAVPCPCQPPIVHEKFSVE